MRWLRGPLAPSERDVRVHRGLAGGAGDTHGMPALAEPGVRPPSPDETHRQQRAAQQADAGPVEP